jgi:hypothetical protein
MDEKGVCYHCNQQKNVSWYALYEQGIPLLACICEDCWTIAYGCGKYGENDQGTIVF